MSDPIVGPAIVLQWRADIVVEMEAIVEWCRERPDLSRDSIEFKNMCRMYNIRATMLRSFDNTLEDVQ